MCFSPDIETPAPPPPPAPAPVETGKLQIKATKKKGSMRSKKRKSGSQSFRSDLSLPNGPKGGSGLSIKQF